MYIDQFKWSIPFGRRHDDARLVKQRHLSINPCKYREFEQPECDEICRRQLIFFLFLRILNGRVSFERNNLWSAFKIGRGTYTGWINSKH